MNNPPVALILSGPKRISSPPHSEAKYRLGYEELSRRAEKNGLVLYRASSSWYDPLTGSFTSTWRFQNNRWIQGTHPVKPDVIYDKMRPSPERLSFKKDIAALYPFLNDPELSVIADNKWTTYELLGRFQKPSWLIKNVEDYQLALSRCSTSRFVAKPLFGSGGKSIVIGEKHSPLPALPFPFLLQEFIDSSTGIQGVCPGYHDLRLVFIGTRLIYSYIRTPAKGSLLANVARGGTMQIIPNDVLPVTLEQPIRAVQTLFKRYSHPIYTIDFMFEAGDRPYIVEVNSMPGIYFSPGQEEIRDVFYQVLIQELLAAAQEK